MITSVKYNSFYEFYPFYLSQHRNNLNRLLHFIGTFLSLLNLLYSLLSFNFITILLSPVYGYTCAWVGHFFFEKNKPATFKHPFYSLIGDFQMMSDILTGRLNYKFKAYAIENIRKIPLDFI